LPHPACMSIYLCGASTAEQVAALYDKEFGTSTQTGSFVGRLLMDSRFESYPGGKKGPLFAIIFERYLETSSNNARHVVHHLVAALCTELGIKSDEDAATYLRVNGYKIHPMQTRTHMYILICARRGGINGGKSGHKAAVVSTANRVEKETGVRPSLEEAAFLFARSGHKAAVVSTANGVEKETGVRPSDEEATKLLTGMAGAASLGKRRKNDSEWYVLVPFPPLKTESRCGDTKQKIAAQLVTDGIGYQFGTLANDYMNRWCKTASGNDAKSVLIERFGKKWQLSIVKKKQRISKR